MSNLVFVSPVVVMFLVALPAMVLLSVTTDEGVVQSPLVDSIVEGSQPPTEIPNLIVE